MQRRQIRFDGRVQGVGFRATAEYIAGRHPVTGWVRNEQDGSVLLQAQGGPEAIDQFLGDLRSRLGRYIQSEQANDVPIVEGESHFRITH
jgi:acylphosphatase